MSSVTSSSTITTLLKISYAEINTTNSQICYTRSNSQQLAVWALMTKLWGVSEWVGFNVLHNTVQVISRTAFAGKIAHTHNNKTKSLTFMKHKKRPTPKIVRTADYNCAYVMIMAVLIIFSVILQPVINLISMVLLTVRSHGTMWHRKWYWPCAHTWPIH